MMIQRNDRVAYNVWYTSVLSLLMKSNDSVGFTRKQQNFRSRSKIKVIAACMAMVSPDRDIDHA